MMTTTIMMTDQKGVAAGFPATSEPPLPCTLCPRLHQFVVSQQAEHPDWHNGPVPTYGDADAELLIAGLAPGLRGANRTGRPFTAIMPAIYFTQRLGSMALREGLMTHGPTMA
jgi:hypothetical protein